MQPNPFEEYASLEVIHGRVVASLDGWQVSANLPAVDLFKAVQQAAETAVWAMEYQSSLKGPYLTSLCRQAREEIPFWNVRARRDFDRNMVHWLGTKEAELKAAAEEKIHGAYQQ
jgi:hypothetical protein